MGTGVFVAVVGPSGAGKDSLIDGARTALAGDRRFYFARRYITRPRHAGGERHVEISLDAFERECAAASFALSWRAHGVAYGIDREVAARIEAGQCVIANLSRGVLNDARAIFANTCVVHVSAPSETLAARLAERSRESPAAIEARLAREAPMPSGLDIREIANAGPLDVGVRTFVRILREFSGVSHPTSP